MIVMKKNRHGFARHPTAIAVQAVLIGFSLVPVGAALAQAAGGDASVAELTTPTQMLEIGAGDVSRDAIKANEYDGLQRHGAYGIIDFDLRGGGAYDSNDPTRWRILGTDLGLETRDIELEYGQQGTFRLNAGFDELLRSGSAVYDSISTPYQGVGTTNLTLPSNWSAPLYPSAATMGAGNTYPAPSGTMLGLAATSYGSPLVTGTTYVCRTTTNGCVPNAALGGAYTTGLPVTAANTAMLTQNRNDLDDFQSVRLSTRRDKQDYGATYELSTRWNVSVGMQREDKHGIKPLGVVNSGNGGYAGENATIIPEVIDTTTDQYHASLNFKGEQAYGTVAYYGSMFDNHAKSMTLQNPYAVGTYNGVTQNAYGNSSATISEEPNSTFNQFRLGGGYHFTPTLKLVADAAYGRNEQNDSFVLDPSMFATPTGAAGAATNNGASVPTNSANALVVTKSLDLKLSARPISKLNLDAAYKFDERDNQTPIHTFVWYDDGAKNFGAPNGLLNGANIPGVASGLPIYSGVNIVDNRPYSKKVNQLDGTADYAFAKGQAVKAGVEWQSIDRWCNDSWIDCSFADRSHETTGKLEYRFTPSGPISGRIAADYGSRHVDYNPNAWMSLAPALGATNIPTLATAGYSGTILGFMNANGLSPYGLPIGANASSGLTGSNLAVYNLLYGAGNGGLTNSYYGINNVTQNWPGLDVYNMANRDRGRLRGSADWQVSDAFALQAGADYRHDKYPDQVYGLESSSNWNLNLDGDLRASDDLTLSAYIDHEDTLSTVGGNSASNGSVAAVSATTLGTHYTTATGATGTNTTVAGGCIASSSTAGLTNPTQYQVYENNLKISPCTGWQSDMHERADTLGVAAKKSRFVVPKLTLSGDLGYTRSVTSNGMTGGNYTANTLAAYVAGAPAISYVQASALPDVVVSTLRLRLVGEYQVSKTSVVRLGYSFTHIQVTDYTYTSTLPAYTSSSVMPAMSQAPGYSVSVVGVSYVLHIQ
jgi:hypothetical protein